MSNQIALNNVINLQFMDFATDSPLFYVDYAQTTEIDNGGTRVEVRGGQGNYLLTTFDHTKTAGMKLNVPLADLNLLAQLSGDTLQSGTQNVFMREVWTVDAANTITLSQTPVGTSLTLYPLVNQRDLGTKIASSNYTVSTKTVTFTTGANPGDKIVAWYQYATPTGSVTYTMKANKFTQAMHIVGFGVGIDQVTETQRTVQIEIFKAKFKPTFNFQLTSTNASVINLELDMLAVPQGNDLAYYSMKFV